MLGPFVNRSQKKDSKRYACSRNLKQPKVYEAYSKFTKRRAEKLALDENGAKEVFEKMYKNYVFNDIDIKYSEFVSGCYIYARMRNYMGDKNYKAKITRVFVDKEKHQTA